MRTILRKRKRSRYRLVQAKKAFFPAAALLSALLFGGMFFRAADALLPVGALLAYGRTGSSEQRPEERALKISDASLPREYALIQKETSAVESLPEQEVVWEIPEENKAELVYKTYTASSSNIYVPLENGFIKNCTSLSSEEIKAAAEAGPAFSIEDSGEIQVLIMHTHTTESFLPFTEGAYDVTYSTRTTNNEKNMCAVGEAIVQKLKEAGIGVIHDMTQHDYPSYNGSYDRSRETVQSYLKSYPSIKVVLDVHRDAIVSGNTAVAPVADIGGRTAAQIMIISGCDDGTMDYPQYLKNLGFAGALQNALEGMYPG